jgi:hypothetical protein
VFHELQLYTLQLPHLLAWNNISQYMLSPSFPVNKQLNDKERVAAALENSNLLDTVEECLSPTLG